MPPPGTVGHRIQGVGRSELDVRPLHGQGQGGGQVMHVGALNACANGHKAVVYAGSGCPACYYMDEVTGLTQAVSILQREVDALRENGRPDD